MQDTINNFIKIQEKYKNNVSEIDKNLKSKYFIPKYDINQNKINIKCFDDMYPEMYFKSKYLDNSYINKLNMSYDYTNDVIRDVKCILNKINIIFLHDNKFKISKSEKKSNYFNPLDENQIILYNSIDKTTYQQSEFRKQIWKIEEEINEYTKLNNHYSINIDFYNDEKYEMVWILCKINKV
jgi:hypothetical protein